MATDPITNKPDPTSPRSAGESSGLLWAVFIFVAIVISAIGYGLYNSEGRFLLQLQETAVSRGLITFLVAVVTVSIALVIAVWVIASNADAEVTKARFSYAKDILGTLVGILGTILGFYFGSADKLGAEQLALAEIQIKSGQLITHASGGTAPYRYSILPSEVDPKTAGRVSKDGWIFEQIPSSFKPGITVTIEVVDAKDHKASRTMKYLAEERDTTPSPTSTSRTSQTPSQAVPVPPLQPASPASR